MKNIPIQDRIASRVASLPQHADEPLEAAINHALLDYVERVEEESHRWRETLAAEAAIAEGRGIAGDKVMAWLASWGKDNELSPP